MKNINFSDFVLFLTVAFVLYMILGFIVLCIIYYFTNKIDKKKIGIKTIFEDPNEEINNFIKENMVKMK